MKQLLVLTAIGLFLCTSCKKNTSSVMGSIATNSFPAPSTTSITKQQAQIINSLLTQGKVRDPADFKAKVDSVQALYPYKQPKVQVTDAPTYAPGEDDENYSVNVPDGQNTETDLGFNKIVNTSLSTDVIFPKRGNQMRVLIPFQYTLGRYPNANTNTITNLQATQPVLLIAEGGLWGQVTQLNDWGVNGTDGFDPYMQSVGLNAYGNAQEERTLLYSTLGQNKLSINVDLKAFKVGDEYTSGFTISSAAYTFNTYQMHTNAIVTIEAVTSVPSAGPKTYFSGTLQVTQTGILRNQ